MPVAALYKAISINTTLASYSDGTSFFAGDPATAFNGYFEYDNLGAIVNLYDSNGVNIPVDLVSQPSYYTDDYIFNLTITGSGGSTYFELSTSFPVIISGDGSSGMQTQNINDAGMTYQVTNSSSDTYFMISFSSYTPPPPPTPPRVVCFKEDSKILCLIDNVETYVPVQDIRKGVLVKTSKNGFKAVEAIGTSQTSNSEETPVKDRLFICSNDKYPEVFEDLYVTGSHSILVDELTEVQREKIIQLVRRIFVTDNKYRLMACIDERAKLFNEVGRFNIYHLALENENKLMNYGIYANGLLVETCSINFLTNKSTMKLLE
jgi:hypothetical protein